MIIQESDTPLFPGNNHFYPAIDLDPPNLWSANILYFRLDGPITINLAEATILKSASGSKPIRP
jgi:hypothetical protein